MCTDHRADAGFTLMEVLVAMTILGIVMLTVYGTLSRALEAKAYSEDRAELYAAGRQAVLKMAEDLEAALPPNTRADVHFRALTKGDHPPADAVQFNINVHSRRSIVPRSGRSTIQYSLDPVGDGERLFVLRRDDLPLVTTQSEPDPTLAEPEPEPKPSAIYFIDPTDCTDGRFCVTGLRLSYFVGKTGEWVQEWDSTQRDRYNELPTMVQIELYLSDHNGAEHEFRTIVDLVLAPSSLATPTPAAGAGGAGTAGPQ